MTAQAAAQQSSATVAIEIRRLEQRKVLIEEQHRKDSTRILSIDEETRRLKVKFAGGDDRAAAAMDQLDDERKNLVRKIEGLQIPISQLENEILSLRRQAQQFAEMESLEASEQRFEEFQRKLNDLVSARIATYGAACAALYEEAVFIHSEINLLPFTNTDERNRRLRAVEQAHKKLFAVNNDVINRGWKDGPGFAPGPLTSLVAKLPPEQNGNGLH